MISWPKSLVTEIARRRCILFLGAGVAASSRNAQGERPKEWKEFLKEAAELVLDKNKQKEVNSLIDQNKLLLALQAVYDEAEPSDYQNLLNVSFNDAAFEPSELHKIVFNLDSRLVITTNFDKIYEKQCLSKSMKGYKVIPYYSDSLADEIRSDTRLIIKAHGSIDEVKGMIFTKAQYHHAKERYGSFYSILKALLLTNTCIFIGCGMDDPDVLLILEEVRIAANSDRPHYALFREGSHTEFVKKDLASAYNVRCLEYGPGHDNLIEDLKELEQQIDGMRALG
ncbi:SIR2 family protein [Pseudogulbenkiania ferrooxidans]|uniref:SIR2 family protein n=1 Tax=Pseudogulbenkiania ferrooxidans TaxID=549169 RepID=UPI0009DB9FBD|nr:SIR2 family protein [Pseudogulbenkiania ferrooxidans]